jgi:hypothetical protein
MEEPRRCPVLRLTRFQLGRFPQSWAHCWRSSESARWRASGTAQTANSNTGRWQHSHSRTRPRPLGAVGGGHCMDGTRRSAAAAVGPGRESSLAMERAFLSVHEAITPMIGA